MKRLTLAIAGFLCVLVSSATGAQTAEQRDKAWGPFAHAAGRTSLSDSGKTKARWYWVEPGKSLMQEYRSTEDDDLVYRETLITLGSEPGTLVLAARPVGMPPEKPYVAVIQPDGRLYLPLGADTPDTGNLLEFTGDDVLVYSAARISDGRAVPNPADKRKYLRFPLDPAPVAVAAQPEPTSDANVGVAATVEPQASVVAVDSTASAAPAAPTPPAPTAPLDMPAAAPGPVSLDPQSLRKTWGPLADLVGHDWLLVYPSRTISGPGYPVSFAWQVPGKSIVSHMSGEETVYTLAADGSIRYVTTPTPAWDTGEPIFYLLDESRISQWSGQDRRGMTVLRSQPNGQVVIWEHFSNSPEVPRPISAYVRADGSTGLDMAPQNGNPLRNPAAWGPFAALANARVSLWGMRAPIVSADGDAMHFVRVPGGTGKPYPEFTVRLAPDGTFMMRIFSTTSSGEERGYFREGVLQGDTIEWRKPGTALMQEAWRMERSANGLLNMMTTDWTDPSHWSSWVVTPTYYQPGVVDEALARLEAYDKTIARQVALQRGANLEKASAGPYNKFAQAANAALDVGMAVYQATVPQPVVNVPPAGAQATPAGSGVATNPGGAGTTPTGSRGSGTGVATTQGGTSSMPAPAPAVKQCRTVTKTYSRRSLPKPSIAEAQDYIAKFPSSCHLGAQPSMGPADCSEDSEPIVTKDAQGIPRVTGRQTLYTCEVVLTCPASEVCEGESTGASAQ